MSMNDGTENMIKILDKTLEFAKADTGEIRLVTGIKEVTMNKMAATSWDANTNTTPVFTNNSWARTGKAPVSMQWSFNTPFSNIVIDRCWRVSFEVDFIVDNSAAGQNAAFHADTKIALRQMPLIQACKSISLTLNGREFTYSPEQYSQAMLRYNNDERYRAEHWVGAPSQPDVARTLLAPSVSQSAFAEPYASSFVLEGSRLEQSNNPTLVNTNTQVIYYRYVIDCPIYAPPLLLEKGHGMSNITSIDLRIDISCLSNLFSVYKTNNPTGTIKISPTANKPELYLKYITPNFAIPKQITLPSQNIYTDVTQVSVTANNPLTADTKSELLKFNNIPSYFYVFIRKRTTNRAVTDSDADFLPITKISIQVDNKPSLYVNASQKQLYDVSVGNGLNCSYYQFANYSGSVLCFAYGQDIPLNDGVYVGSAVSNTLQVTITSTAKAPADADYDLVVCVVRDCRAMIGPNNADQLVGLSSAENALAPTLPISGDVASSDIVNSGSGFKRTFNQFKNNGIVKAVANAATKRLINTMTDAIAGGKMIGGNNAISGGNNYVNRF